MKTTANQRAHAFFDNAMALIALLRTDSKAALVKSAELALVRTVLNSNLIKGAL